MTTIKPITTHYGNCKFRSRLEARWAVFFDAAQIPWRYEPEGFQLPSGKYLPDFWIPNPCIDFPRAGYWLEIKPREKPADINRVVKLLEELTEATQYDSILVGGDPSDFVYFRFMDGHWRGSTEKELDWIEKEDGRHIVFTQMFVGGLTHNFAFVSDHCVKAAMSARFEFGESG